MPITKNLDMPSLAQRISNIVSRAYKAGLNRSFVRCRLVKWKINGCFWLFPSQILRFVSPLF